MTFHARIQLQKAISLGIKELEMYLNDCGKLAKSETLPQNARDYFSDQVDETKLAIKELKEFKVE